MTDVVNEQLKVINPRILHKYAFNTRFKIHFWRVTAMEDGQSVDNDDNSKLGKE